jgi:rod shape-determining protein MreD
VSSTAKLALRLALLALATVLVQTAALSQLSLFGAIPDVSPLVVASVGLLAGPLAGSVMGFGVGLLVDVALLQTLGISSLVYVIVGHFSGRLRETTRDPEATLLPLLAGGLGTAVALTVFSIIQFLLGVDAPVSLELLRQIVSTILINTLIALPVHAAVRRALGASASSGTRRRGRRRSARRDGRAPLSPLIQP